MIKQNFLEAINKSFDEYIKNGARSNKKLYPLHGFLAKEIFDKIGDDFEVKSLGINNNKEETLSGKYYNKKIDISIIKNNKIISVISFKFVTSNYKQNANNYFEQLMGECANIKRTGVGFAHFLILRGKTPYYSKNKGNLKGDLKKTELLSQKEIVKYVKLFQDIDNAHKPDLLGMALIDFNDDNKSNYINFDDFGFDENVQNLLKKEFCLEVFLEKFIHLTKFKSL